MTTKTIEDIRETIGHLRHTIAMLESLIEDIDIDPNVQPTLPGLFDDIEDEKAPAITIEDIRSVLADVSRKGHTARVRELLNQHGCSKLSEVPVSDYPTLMKEAQKLAKEYADA